VKLRKVYLELDQTQKKHVKSEFLILNMFKQQVLND
jgi:hypothetical protein